MASRLNIMCGIITGLIIGSFLITVESSVINLEEDLSSFMFQDGRQGWKTSGNGNFIYNAPTNFNYTEKLEIRGKFSTKPNSVLDNVLVAAEDGNGTVIFQYAVCEGMEKLAIRLNDTMMIIKHEVPGVTSGYLFSFLLTVSQTVDSNGHYNHWIKRSLSGDTWDFPGTGDDLKWDLDHVTLYIGGYPYPDPSGNLFEGCLSDFMFEGVDIIERYFAQYPNNINPVQGPLVVGNFSHVPQTCDDLPLTTTIKPTTTSTATSSTTEKSTTWSTAINLELMKCLLLLSITYVILSI